MRRFFLPFLLLFFLVAAFFFFKHSGKRAPVNILFITIDTLRSDHCSGYGYPLKTTPGLDKLSQEGVQFEQAYAPMATTAGSHATMFTSLYPLFHGVVKNAYVLGPKFETLAERLQKQGYETSAFVSSFVLESKFGFEQGFATYDDNFIGGKSSINWKRWQGNKVKDGFDRRADVTTQRVLEWLSSLHGQAKPFFLWVHYFDPHGPYDPPKSFRDRFQQPQTADPKLASEIAAYDGEINFTDNQLTRIVNFLNNKDLRGNTLIVITADHGEGLLQHGWMGHGRHVYEEAVKVPLIFSWPGVIPEGKKISGPVELVDLTPTILELAGVPVQASDFQGRSLVSSIYGKVLPDPNRKIYLQRRHYDGLKGEKFGIRQSDFKYIEALEEGIRELYDLRKDPKESNNIYDQIPQKAKELAMLLEVWKESHSKTGPIQAPISNEDQERLKALGYVQ